MAWIEFCNHTNNHFVLRKSHCLHIYPCRSTSNLPELFTILIVELKAPNAIRIFVVDFDMSYHLFCVLGHQIGIVGLTLITLGRSTSIRHYKVERCTSTILLVVTEPCKGIKQSHHLINVSWPFKLFGTFWVYAYWLWSFDSVKVKTNSKPLS